MNVQTQIRLNITTQRLKNVLDRMRARKKREKNKERILVEKEKSGQLGGGYLEHRGANVFAKLLDEHVWFGSVSNVTDGRNAIAEGREDVLNRNK